MQNAEGQHKCYVSMDVLEKEIPSGGSQAESVSQASCPTKDGSASSGWLLCYSIVSEDSSGGSDLSY